MIISDKVDFIKVSGEIIAQVIVEEPFYRIEIRCGEEIKKLGRYYCRKVAEGEMIKIAKAAKEGKRAVVIKAIDSDKHIVITDRHNVYIYPFSDIKPDFKKIDDEYCVLIKKDIVATSDDKKVAKTSLFAILDAISRRDMVCVVPYENEEYIWDEINEEPIYHYTYEDAKKVFSPIDTGIIEKEGNKYILFCYDKKGRMYCKGEYGTREAAEEMRKLLY